MKKISCPQEARNSLLEVLESCHVQRYSSPFSMANGFISRNEKSKSAKGAGSCKYDNSRS